MIPGLKEIDTVPSHPIDQPVFPVDTARPRTSKLVLEGFRLTDAGERLSQNGVNKLQNA